MNKRTLLRAGALLAALLTADLAVTLPLQAQPASTPTPATKELPPLKLPDIPDDDTPTTAPSTPRKARTPGPDIMVPYTPLPGGKDLGPLRLPDAPREDLDDDVPDVPETSGKPIVNTTVPAALPVPPGPPIVNSALPRTLSRSFRIEYAGRLVGYSRFNVTGSMSLDNDSSYIIDSEARLKLGVGSKSDTTFTAKLMADTGDLTPHYFRCMQVAGTSNFTVECLYSKTMIAQTNGAGKQRQESFEQLDGKVPSLLFNNLWGHLDTFPEHYWLLVRSAVKGGTLHAYDPILRGGGDLVVYAPKAEKWNWEGRTLDTLVYPVSDMEGTLMAHVRVTKDLDLLEVREVGNGLTMRRTTGDVVAEVARVQPLDLLSRRVVASNVLFNEPEKLTSLDADITVSLRGGEVAEHKLNAYTETFTGQMKDGVMKGHVNVRTNHREAVYRTKYPFRKEARPPAALERYVKPGPGVESEWPTVKNKALELAWKSENTFQAARRIMASVSQIEEGVSLPSARYALDANVGNPESKALLMVAMCRAVGMPARRVGGLLFRDGQFVPHNWAEVWLGPTEGWTPFDPTTSEAGHIGASHIELWESGDVEKVNIAVTNYSPRAPRRVAFFNHELNWGVGEERTYNILKNGKTVGQEVAAVRELVVNKNADEAYRFESVTTLPVANNNTTVNVTSELMVTPQGLPLSFNTEGAPKQGPSYVFSQDTAKVQSGSMEAKNKVIKEIPFSFGTYLADPHFLSQWALAVGQSTDPSKPDKAPKAGDKLSFYIFIPETGKSQEIVLEVKDPETVKLGDGREMEATKLEADGGMAFFVGPKGQVVKIDVPEQKLELLLRDSRFKVQ